LRGRIIRVRSRRKSIGRQSLDTKCGMQFPESKSRMCFPLLMPTYGPDLSKISNSYDKFRQTLEEVLGKKGYLAEKSGRNPYLRTW
jgi:hypothetical protein